MFTPGDRYTLKQKVVNTLKWKVSNSSPSSGMYHRTFYDILKVKLNYSLSLPIICIGVVFFCWSIFSSSFRPFVCSLSSFQR